MRSMSDSVVCANTNNGIADVIMVAMTATPSASGRIILLFWQVFTCSPLLQQFPIRFMSTQVCLTAELFQNHRVLIRKLHQQIKSTPHGLDIAAERRK